jgi:hypothetical protein
LHPSPIQDQLENSSIEEQPRQSPPWTRSTLLPTPNVMQAKATKNVCDKSHPQQQKMSSKATKGKKPMKELKANPKMTTAMTQANLKFVLGKSILIVDALKQAGKSCVELHNYYINNYNKNKT